MAKAKKSRPRRKRSEFSLDATGADPGTQVTAIGDTDGDVSVDPLTGLVKIENGDGSVTIDTAPDDDQDQDTGADKFDENLADRLDERELDRICSMLLDAIDADEKSRAEWLETRAKGIDLLGFRIEEPRGDTGGSTAPVEGMSTVRHPVLTEAVIRFQSNASAELLPSVGPVKVRSDAIEPPIQLQQALMLQEMKQQQPPGMGHNGGPPMGAPAGPPPMGMAAGGGVPPAPPPGAAPKPPAPPSNPNAPLDDADSKDTLAEALEKDLNHYLTVVDKGYRSDTDRMLFWVGFGGCGFKKVYHCPIRRMPISRSVDAKDLIVSDAANEIDDAGRVTHRILMRKSTLIRMRIAGVYRKTDVTSTPNPEYNAEEDRVAEIQGFQTRNMRPEDQPYTVYECYCELDIKGFEHEENGEITGLELPYRVTIEKDSREILEIRRNWREDDPNCLAKKVFVKFPFVPALGFYDIGLLHILGNTDRALTAAWRLALDAGMFASFPGFLFSDVTGRQQTNQFRVPPGGGMKIQTGSKPITDVVMPLPYKDMTQGLQALTTHIEQTAQRVGGTAEVSVAEGKQDAPVGTTLALIEQATKMLAAVHVRLHAAQAEEFQLLKECLREDPQALWRHNRKPAAPWEVATFLKALDDYDIVPAADPNTPSHMHRLMKAVALVQLTQAAPGLYDLKAVNAFILRNALGIHDPQSLMAKAPPPGAPPAPPPDPAKMAELNLKSQIAQQQNQVKVAEMQADTQAKNQEGQARAQEIALESQDRSAERAGRQQLEAMKIQAQQEKNRQDAAQADAQRTHEAQQANLDRQHEANMAAMGHAHEAQQANVAQAHEAQQANLGFQHEMHRGGMAQQHEEKMAQMGQAHEAQQANVARTHEAMQSTIEREAQADQSAQDREFQATQHRDTMNQKDADRQAGFQQQKTDLDHQATQAVQQARAKTSEKTKPKKGNK